MHKLILEQADTALDLLMQHRQRSDSAVNLDKRAAIDKNTALHLAVSTGNRHMAEVSAGNRQPMKGEQ